MRHLQPEPQRDRSGARRQAVPRQVEVEQRIRPFEKLADPLTAAAAIGADRSQRQEPQQTNKQTNEQNAPRRQREIPISASADAPQPQRQRAQRLRRCGAVATVAPVSPFYHAQFRCAVSLRRRTQRRLGSLRRGRASDDVAPLLGRECSTAQLQRSALLSHRNSASRCNDAMCCNDARCRCPPRPLRSARCPPHRRAGLRDAVAREVERHEVGDGRDRRNERRRRPASKSPARSALTAACVPAGFKPLRACAIKSDYRTKARLHRLGPHRIMYSAFIKRQPTAATAGPEVRARVGERERRERRVV